ncbi:MAG: hypothetical protein P0119_22740 [Nitrospira sp.]|nr:hypothetical protein [Nitrospira sp.]
MGNRTSMTDAASNTTEFEYDEVNRVVTITLPATTTQTFTYDAVGNKLAFTNENDETTTFTYDDVNRLETQTNELNETTEYEYDNVGNVLTTTQPQSLVTTFEYDDANRLVSKETPNDTTTYAFDAANNLVLLTMPSGAYREYEYDEVNRVETESRYEADDDLITTFTYGYDENGNRTSVTQARPGQSNVTVSYEYDALNRQTAFTDPSNYETTYDFDAAGNLQELVNGNGIVNTMTYNDANQLETTTQTVGAQTWAETTNVYEDGQLTGWVTSDVQNSLTLTSTLGYNGNAFIEQADVSHVGSASHSLTSTLGYTANNLLDTWEQQNQNTNHMVYDDAQRLVCSEFGGAAREYIEYDDSGRREKRYWQLGNNSCATIVANPASFFANSWGYKRSEYEWNGNRLVSEEARECNILGSGPCGYSYFYDRTLAYDDDGNVNQMVKVTNSLTVTMEYAWEPGTHQLNSVTRTATGQSSYTASLSYDPLGRIKQFCQWVAGGDYCHKYFYVGDGEWLSWVEDGGNITREIYLHANGRPLRVGLRYINQFPPWYHRYNGRGDATFVPQNGDGGAGWRSYGAWGDVNYASDNKGYYNWNAAWGYMRFPDRFNFNLHDVLDVGLYYAHGRWYNQDTGLWLSPNEKGDYLYGEEDKNEPINTAQTQTPGYSREYFTNLAKQERLYLELFQQIRDRSYLDDADQSLARLAAFEVVGEIANCPNQTTCKLEAGAILLTVQNRYEICRMQARCPYSVRGLPSRPTRSEIIVADCERIPCLQYKGLEHWIRILNSTRCDITRGAEGSECYSLTKSAHRDRFDWGFEVAQKIFSGSYRHDELLDELVQTIGGRVNFGNPCGKPSPTVPSPSVPSPTPDPTSCTRPYGIHFFWGP